MMFKCFMSFENGTGVYSGGENVSGIISIVVQERSITSGIHVTIFGKCKVHWNESSILHGSSKYLGYDNYFSNRTYLVGDESGQLSELEEQIYNYNYSSLLPQRLPSSFLGEHGVIEYFVVVAIDHPYRSNEYFRRGFTVIYNLDLNSDPRYRIPELRQKDTSLHNCCFKSRTLLVRLTTPSTGYVPGQSISFTCFVNNKTANNIDVLVGLEQQVCFTSESPCTKTKSTSNSVVRKTFSNIESFSDREFYETLLIPSIPPSTQDTCKCIEISYYLYAEAETGFFLKNLLLIIPVTIGAIPICEIPPETMTELTTVPTTSTGLQRGPTIFRSITPIAIPESPDSPLITTPQGEDLPPSYVTFRPPSYRDAVILLKKPKKPPKYLLKKRNSAVERRNSNQFVPKYPVYENFTPFASSPDREPGGTN